MGTTTSSTNAAVTEAGYAFASIVISAATRAIKVPGDPSKYREYTVRVNERGEVEVFWLDADGEPEAAICREGNATAANLRGLLTAVREGSIR